MGGARRVCGGWNGRENMSENTHHLHLEELRELAYFLENHCQHNLLCLDGTKCLTPSCQVSRKLQEIILKEEVGHDYD
jgi:hypothetical protein